MVLRSFSLNSGIVGLEEEIDDEPDNASRAQSYTLVQAGRNISAAQ